jgi:hypothetical protein
MGPILRYCYSAFGGTYEKHENFSHDSWFPVRDSVFRSFIIIVTAELVLLSCTCPKEGAEISLIWSYEQSRDSLATGWTIVVLGFDSRRGLGIFLFTTASRTVLRLTQPPIQWIPGALSLGVKRPGREADHAPPSSAEVKNKWSYTSPNTPSWCGAWLSTGYKN